jgi:hypothetical protein
MFTRRRERRTRHRRRRLDLGVARLGKTGQAVVLGLPVKEILVAGVVTVRVTIRCICSRSGSPGSVPAPAMAARLRPGRPAEGRDTRTDSGDCRSPWIDRVAWVSFLPG